MDDETFEKYVEEAKKVDFKTEEDAKTWFEEKLKDWSKTRVKKRKVTVDQREATDPYYAMMKTDKPISAEDSQVITERWHTKQSQRQVAVLGQGFEWQTVQLNPRDALFTDVQVQQVQAIARLFGIPARLLLTGVDGSSDTYTNLQDENQVFYRHTIMAYTDAISDALSECLPRGTRVEFNFEGLFRADMANRFNMYETAIRAGFMTTEEVRRKEGLE